MNQMITVYRCLLVDASRLLMIPEIRGSWVTSEWLTSVGPQLEKDIMSLIEARQTNSVCDVYSLMEEIRLLAERIVSAELQPVFAKTIHHEIIASAWLASKYNMDNSFAVRRSFDFVNREFGHWLKTVRQLLLFAKKATTQYDTEQLRGALRSFVRVNSEVGEFSSAFASKSPRLLKLAQSYCQSAISHVDWKNILPSHGPGAVTTSKDRWQRWYNTIEQLYPYSDYFCVYHSSDHNEQVLQAEQTDDIEAKLIAVPKDSSGPRLICVHPAEAMWIQQGLRRQLERAISRRMMPHRASPRGKIRFKDQTVNGSIAMTSSRSKKYATLDLKDASDRVSDVLVQCLFGRAYKYFGCCRARTVRVPDGKESRLVNLHMYAPMGNATVFPVQSIVFWSICCAALHDAGHKHPTSCFVFGDDIICPTEYVERIIDALTSFGLCVNTKKSYWRSAFRESCGVDAYHGVDVTPIRWKLSSNVSGIVDLQSLSSLAQRLRRDGWAEAAASCYAILSKHLHLIGRRLGVTNNPDHGGICEFVPSPGLAIHRSVWDDDLQCWMSSVLRLKTVTQRRNSDDWNHLLESLVRPDGRREHEASTERVSRRVLLTRGWSKVL